MQADADQAMIEAQAKRISMLQDDLKRAQSDFRKEITRLGAQHSELEARIRKNQQAGEFYLQLQQAILDNPVLQSEWERFCSFLKLADYDDYDCKKPDLAQRVEASEISFMGLQDKHVPMDSFRPRMW